MANKITTDYIYDNRSAYKASQDFHNGKKNELFAMRALVDYYFLRGIRCDFDYVDDQEEWLDNRVHNKPDFFFYRGIPNGKKYSLEVKFCTTGRFYNDSIYIKPSPFWTSRKHPEIYPNFMVLVATKNQFTIIRDWEFKEECLGVSKQWSTDKFQKKVYKFSVNRKWYKWDYEIDSLL